MKNIKNRMPGTIMTYGDGKLFLHEKEIGHQNGKNVNLDLAAIIRVGAKLKFIIENDDGTPILGMSVKFVHGVPGDTKILGTKFKV